MTSTAKDTSRVTRPTGTLCRFARAYTDQTESDDQALVAAVAHGALPASVGTD
jgi:hypothetical protein